ncbi:hypothetical protein SHIRM173S_07779 [Streptomyces hirsutus]
MLIPLAADEAMRPPVALLARTAVGRAAARSAVRVPLRRTFSAYESGVRRTLGELVRRGPGAPNGSAATGFGAPGFAPGLDSGRADAVLPVVRLLLGLDEDTRSGEGDGGDARAGLVGTAR